MSRARITAAKPWPKRADLLLRVIAAIPLGYAVASLWAMALARLLPGPRSEATIAATLIAFVLCAIAAMWAFAARSGWRAIWMLAVAGAPAAVIAWLSVQAAGRL